MAILRIYADEAGRKPLDDDDGPFVAAAVSVVGIVPDFDEANGRKEWLIERLMEIDAIPYYSTIIPYPGYGAAMRGKLGRLDAMSRLNRIATGATAKYLGRDGFNLRNMIWVHAMQDAIHIAFLRAVARENVERVEVIVDQQDLHMGLRQMLSDQMAGMRGRLLSSIEKIHPLNPSVADKLLSRCPVDDDFLLMKINNDPNPDNAECGLKLAHYLASMTFQDLRNPHGVPLSSHLSEAGFSDYSRDLTEWATAPFSPDAIAQWKVMTGLQVPT